MVSARSLGLCALILAGAAGFQCAPCGVPVHPLPRSGHASSRAKASTTRTEAAALSATAAAVGAAHAAANPLLASSLQTAAAAAADPLASLQTATEAALSSAGVPAELITEAAEAEEVAQAAATGLLGNEFTWVLLLTILTYAVGAAFEGLVHTAKTKIPRAYTPVLEVRSAEIDRAIDRSPSRTCGGGAQGNHIAPLLSQLEPPSSGCTYLTRRAFERRRHAGALGSRRARLSR